MDLKRNFEFLSSANRIGEDVKTVDDLLARDDINHILSNVIEVKRGMKRLVVVWEDDQGVLDWRVSNMRMSKFIGLVEMAKMYAMMDNELNECGEED